MAHRGGHGSLSPTKEVLNAEVHATKLEYQNLREEAHHAWISQRDCFERSASEYQTLARDTCVAEVAQSQAMAEAHYMSTLNHLHQAAESEVGTQRERIMTEAREALASQKHALVEEAKAYLEEQQKRSQNYIDHLRQEVDKFHEENSDLKVHHDVEDDYARLEFQSCQCRRAVVSGRTTV